MKSCLIFLAGEWDSPLPELAYDVVIAADAGYAHCQKLGIQPHVILGDFDSLGAVPPGAEIWPVEKDDTDAMLAARRALELGCDTLYFCAALDGPRLDHTVANFQTLVWLKDRGVRAYLLGNRQLVTLMEREVLCFPAGARGTLSVFSYGEKAEGVTLRGLYYGLEQGSLTNAFPLGVSNHFTGERAEISVESGKLLLIWDRKAGFPGAEGVGCYGN